MYIMTETVIIEIGIIGTITIGTIRTITIGTIGTTETEQLFISSGPEKSRRGNGIRFEKLFAGEGREVSKWTKFYVAPIQV